MAQKRLYPEYISLHNESDAISEQLLQWLTDRAAYEQITSELADLKSRTAQPGACERAAKYILETLTSGKRRSRMQAARGGVPEAGREIKTPTAAA
jgi:lipid-A-disaccharide synthase